MKKCTYCGREHSDEAIVCEIDESPLEHTIPQSVKLSHTPSSSESTVPELGSVTQEINTEKVKTSQRTTTEGENNNKDSDVLLSDVGLHAKATKGGRDKRIVTHKHFGLLVSNGKTIETAAADAFGCFGNGLIVLAIIGAVICFGSTQYMFLPIPGALLALGLFMFSSRKQQNKEQDTKIESNCTYAFDGMMFDGADFEAGSFRFVTPSPIDFSKTLYKSSREIEYEKSDNYVRGKHPAGTFGTDITEIEFILINSKFDRQAFQIVFLVIYLADGSAVELDSRQNVFVVLAEERLFLAPPLTCIGEQLRAIGEACQRGQSVPIKFRIVISPRTTIHLTDKLRNLFGIELSKEAFESGSIVDQNSVEPIKMLMDTGWEVVFRKAPDLGLAGESW